LCAVVLVDTYARRRVHPVYAMGGILLLLVQWGRVAVLQTQEWQSVTDWLAGATVNVDLKVEYSRTRLWNPTTQTYDLVNLRSYQGPLTSSVSPPIAPTIEVLPGDTLRLTLINRLPADPTCHGHHSMNTPHCFNSTNLHTHGLWVDPT